jgi:hypothetical protein
MTKRTRVFLGIACGVLIVGLGTGLVTAYVGGFQNLVILGSDGPDELAYVPQDARMVAYANIREIMSSQLRQKLRDLQTTSPDTSQRRFQDETGIDIENDIDYVFASSVGAQSGAQEDRPLMLARGRFDAARIESLIQERGGVVEEYAGKRVLTQTDQQFSVAFVEPDLVAVGSPDAIHRAIDTMAGSANVKSNADVMRLVHDVDSGTAWAVARFDAIGSRWSGALPSQLPPINWVAMTGHIDGGVRGTMHAETRDEASAQNLQDVIRGMMALARLQVAQHAEFAAFVDSLELSGHEKTVTLGFSVPAEVVDSLFLKRVARPAPAPAPAPGEPREQAPPSTPAL